MVSIPGFTLKLSKMIFNSIVMKCLNPILIIVCSLSINSDLCKFNFFNF